MLYIRNVVIFLEEKKEYIVFIRREYVVFINLEMGVI